MQNARQTPEIVRILCTSSETCTGTCIMSRCCLSCPD